MDVYELNSALHVEQQMVPPKKHVSQSTKLGSISEKGFQQ